MISIAMHIIHGPNSMKYYAIFILLLFSTHAYASSLGYEYKPLSEFERLKSFSTIDEFEESYAGYVQDCLDKTGGGTLGIPCFVGSQLWDRELNDYYKKLSSVLNIKGNRVLKESQRTWINERDKSIDLNSMILDRKFPHEGTMFVLIRAGKAEEIITPIIKQRALLLRQWFELVK